MLFIENDQTQVRKTHFVTKQCVGTHRDRRTPTGQVCQSRTSHRQWIITEQANHAQLGSLQPCLEGAQVLTCEDLRRCKDGRLTPIRSQGQGQREGDHRLSRAHLSVDQSANRASGGKVRTQGLEDLFLIWRELKGNSSQDALPDSFFTSSFRRLRFRRQGGTTAALQTEHFAKRQTAPRRLDFDLIRRAMQTEPSSTQPRNSDQIANRLGNRIFDPLRCIHPLLRLRREQLVDGSLHRFAYLAGTELWPIRVNRLQPCDEDFIRSHRTRRKKLETATGRGFALQLHLFTVFKSSPQPRLLKEQSIDAAMLDV